MAAATADMACTAAMAAASHRSRHHRHPHWHVRYHRPIWYGVRPVGYTAYAATHVAGPCTCLSKEYTPDGACCSRIAAPTKRRSIRRLPAPQQSSSVDAPVQQASNVQYSGTANALPQVDPLTGQPK